MSKKWERERIADLIPHTWLDPLLSGPSAVLSSKTAGKWGCPDIERLLTAIRKRILASPSERRPYAKP